MKRSDDSECTKWLKLLADFYFIFFGDKFIIGSGSKCGNDERRPFLRESSTTGDNRLHVVNCSS